MAIDTSQVDILAVIEQECGAFFIGPFRSRGEQVYKGPCPWCKGTDRFCIFTETDKPRFYCGVNGGSGCAKHGDVIAFLMEWYTCSFAEALDRLKPYGLIVDGTRYENIKPARKTREQVDVAPPGAWQEQAGKLIEQASSFLWNGSDTARKALNYLRKRGLTDESIKSFHLGYIPEDSFQERSVWDLPDETDRQTGKPRTKLSVPRGWLIPWIIRPANWHQDMGIWRLDIRRHPKDLEANPRLGKYHKITGSSEGLFNFSDIQENTPLFIVESPLDTIVGKQEAPAYGWVATGSTSGARDARWQNAVLRAAPVFISFDSDQAGNNAASYWKSEKITRRRPWAHDINDMLLAGLSIQEWADEAIEMLSQPTSSNDDEITVSSGSENAVSNPPEEIASHSTLSDETPSSDFCAVCSKPVEDTDKWSMSPDGLLFCAACWQSHNLALLLPEDQFDLEVAIQSMQKTPCSGCGGYDWIVDPQLAYTLPRPSHGFLICPCILKKREENRHIGDCQGCSNRRVLVGTLILDSDVHRFCRLCWLKHEEKQAA